VKSAPAVLSLVLALAVAGCGSSSSSHGPTATALGAAGHVPVRTALGATGAAKGAPGRTLGLARVLIPAHSALALHRHPGTQVAYVAQGTLTYTVRRGQVVVMSGAPGASPTVVRRIGAGQTGTIATGQWIVEQPTVVHLGANNGSTPVVVYLATLLTTGSPPSIPVK
jgi:quercetin dioxygenase-like cupin family protein